MEDEKKIYLLKFVIALAIYVVVFAFSIGINIYAFSYFFIFDSRFRILPTIFNVVLWIIFLFGMYYLFKLVASFFKKNG